MDTQIPTIGLNQAQTDSLDLGNQAQNSSSGAELALFPANPTTPHPRIQLVVSAEATYPKAHW